MADNTDSANQRKRKSYPERQSPQKPPKKRQKVQSKDGAGKKKKKDDRCTIAIAKNTRLQICPSMKTGEIVMEARLKLLSLIQTQAMIDRASKQKKRGRGPIKALGEKVSSLTCADLLEGCWYFDQQKHEKEVEEGFREISWTIIKEHQKGKKTFAVHHEKCQEHKELIIATCKKIRQIYKVEESIRYENLKVESRYVLRSRSFTSYYISFTGRCTGR